MLIAMIGTRGVPARYGGFETCVEEVGRRLVERGHDVIVFCRPIGARPHRKSHLGMRLVTLPMVRKRSLETLSHSALSVLHPSLHHVDAAFVFNAANAPVLPILRARRIPVATHVDGLEWRRGKWGVLGQRYYYRAEGLAVRWSDALIADAQGIADYYDEEFGTPTRQIAYGAPILTDLSDHRLAEIDLESRGFHLLVARFEPENHVAELVDGYVRSRAAKPLVVVGSAPYADEYTRHVRGLGDDRVRFLGGVWDAELMDQLYAHASSYLHGHSVGGTNPSLLRAAGAGAYVIAWDVTFNREVLGDAGDYVSTPGEAATALERAENDPDGVRARGLAGQSAIARYDWEDVADGYETLAADLAGGRLPARRRSGRRRSKINERLEIAPQAARAAREPERASVPAGRVEGS